MDAGMGCLSGECESLLFEPCEADADCSDGDDPFQCVDGRCQPNERSSLFPTECGDGVEGARCVPAHDEPDYDVDAGGQHCLPGLVCEYAYDQSGPECFVGICLPP